MRVSRGGRLATNGTRVGSRNHAYSRTAMADKAPKPKSVLGTLPASRPERLGAPRSGKPKPRAVKRAPRTPAASPKPRAVSPGAAPLTRTGPVEGPPPKPLAAPK